MSKKADIPSWQLAQAPVPQTEPSTDPETTPELPESSTAPSGEDPTEDSKDKEEEETETENVSLLEQASKFLDDSTIRDAPWDKKVAFLRSKGVKDEEIEDLRAQIPETNTLNLETVGERAWPKFLTQSSKPPPLITTRRLLTTAYITGGLISAIYGLAQHVVAPMTQNLAETRHDFATHTQEQLEELNKRLGDMVSTDPANKLKLKSNISDLADDVSEADSDPTELFHRDFGTQTTPSLSRRPSVSTTPEDNSVVAAHEKRMKILTSHLRELEATRFNDAASSDSLKTKLSDLTTYVSEMSYQNHFYSGMGSMYGSNYGMPKSKDGKDDQMEVLKSDIRAVKGVLLSARNFPGFTSKLPFGQHKAPQESSEETSLTTLLTSDQCADLTFMMATITATMRKSLLETFTAEETPLTAKPSKSEEDTLKAAPDNLDDVDVEKEDKIKKERKNREEDAEKELAKPEVQELKLAMLKYFDEWRGKVIMRVGEIVNSRAEAEEQSQLVNEKDIEKSVKRQDTGLKSIADIEDKGEDEVKVFRELYPPVETSLTQLDESKRKLILHSLVLILLSLEHYSAHSRILLLHLTSSLHITLSVLKEDEHTIARGLLEAAQTQLNADAETKKRADESSTSRKWKVGLASVAGAALIGVTGGLAAPLLAAGIGTVMGGFGLGATAAAGYLGTLASSSVLVGGLFGAYGARMTGKVMDDYAKEVEDFGFLPIREFHRPRKLEKEFRRLRIAIAISGWLNGKEDVVAPWRVIDSSIEGFALRWELEALMKLGNSMDSFVKSAAWSYAKGQIIKRTIFGALSAGLWPLGLLKISSIIDNPFSVAKVRAEKGGEVLADALINKVQGERPVTLIGYSLGARLIFSCLQTLAERKAFGLVESVVLLGSPCPSDAADWRKIRSVVSGRVVNVFSTNDYILAFLYRTSSIQLGVAGLEPVLGVHGVQNIDVSELVSGHLRYRYLTGSILKKIGFEDIDIEEVEREEAEMKAMEELEREERERKEKKESGKSEEEQKKDLEKEVEKKNQESMMSWVTEKMKKGSIWVSGRDKDKEKSQAEQMVEKEKEVESAKLAPSKS
ncbi:DUF726-domain-containing protein [Pleomassaria siparia CBS 279.74]|uniref:DUF726-domain-containing protein n=1 Tax=Pleomassaria siparia CBS 279.74 TaxID=1314801 RepID=A0A6G1K6H3_9PLEO|nr:DUF726-domain-containing protein [Pleomassaria siparia CBS 279.74]